MNYVMCRMVYIFQRQLLKSSIYVNSAYTVMKKCTDMSHSLDQSFSVQTMDQQQYCIPKQVGIYQMSSTTTLCDLVAFTHSLALFHQLVSSGVMVACVIFSLILVCNAFVTVD